MIMAKWDLRPRLRYVYLWSGLAVGLALIGASLAYGEYVGVFAGGAWSVICVGRLLTVKSSTKVSASESWIGWYVRQRRARRGAPPEDNPR